MTTKQIWLVRHAETAWSKSGQHTGRTDIPLTHAGEMAALALRPILAQHSFALVLSSPRQRAMHTCALAGFEEQRTSTDDLCEWDYGSFEGRTTKEIQEKSPAWDIWRDGCDGGETLAQVAARCQRVIDRCLAVDGDCALFAHGHVSRVLAAVFVQRDPAFGAHLALQPGSISVLGFEHSNRVILRWNLVSDATVALP
ncbi:MAG: histidine phosphatase family protein [Planctomycetota bacterium]|nr:histidine phosphatase family protein [Planctomycetota bacterium]